MVALASAFGSPLATASVRVYADTRRVRPDIEKEFQRSGDAAGRVFNSALSQQLRSAARGLPIGKMLGGPAVGKVAQAAGGKFGEEFTRGVDGKLRDARGRFVTDSEAAGGRAGKAAGKAFGKGIDKDTGVFARVIATSAAKLTLFGAAAGAAAPAVLKLGGALLPATGAAIALPGVLAGAAAAMGTLKLATLGVGDAIRTGFTGDAEEAAAALAKLSPETRVFARSVIDLKSRLIGLQKSAADAFFRRFNTQVQPLAQRYLPVLRAQLPEIAGQMGGLVKQFALAARQGPLLAGVRAVLGNTGAAARAAQGGVRPLVDLFGRLLIVGAPTIKEIGAGFTNLASRAGAFIRQAQQTGQLAGWLAAGKATLRDLGGIFANVGGIVGSVLRAANAGGNTLLSTFRQMTGQVNTFFKSAEGAGALRSVFAVLNQIGQALRVSLAAVLPAVGVALRGLGPTIGNLATAAGQLIVALAPAIPVFAQIAGLLLRAAIPALTALAGWLQRNQGVVKALAVVVGSLVLVMGAANLIIKASGAVTAAWTTITKVAAIATKVWTATTTALGVAVRFALGPIGLIIAGVALLVAGIVYAYRNHEGFRLLVQKVWKAIQGAISVAWNQYIKPALAALAHFFTNVVGPAAMWLWNNALKPAFAGIGTAVAFAWNNVIKPALAALVWYYKNVVGPAALWLWRNIIAPAFKGIGVIISVAWTVIKAVFAAIQFYIRNVLAPVFLFLWNNIIKPVWAGIGFSVKVAWTLIKVIFGLIVVFIRAVLIPMWMRLWAGVKVVWAGIVLAIRVAWVLIRPIFNLVVAFIRTVLLPAFQRFWAGLKVIWNAVVVLIQGKWNILKGIFTAIGGFISSKVVPAFRSGVSAIGSAWARIQELAQRPVRFVVDVLNRGVIGPYRKLAKMFGAPMVDFISFGSKAPFNPGKSGRQEFKGGGVLPGYTPGRDVHEFFSPTGGSMKLSGGEAVMRPEFTRAVGAGFVHGGNAAARRGGVTGVRDFMAGLLNTVGGDPSSPAGGYVSRSGKVGRRAFAEGGIVGFLSRTWDKVSDPSATIKKMFGQAIAGMPGGGTFKNLVGGVGRNVLGKFVTWIGGLLGGGGGFTGPVTKEVGSVQRFIRAQAGKPYRWAAAGPGGYDCSGLVSAAWNLLRGRNPYSHTFSTRSMSSYFRPGRGVFTAGYAHAGERGGGSVGHTAGNLGGLPFESRGGDGVVVGSRATGVNSFARLGHMPGLARGGLIGKLMANAPVFDYGGRLGPGFNMVNNRTGGYEDLVPARRGGGQITVNINGPVGSQKELKDWLVKTTDQLRRERRL